MRVEVCRNSDDWVQAASLWCEHRVQVLKATSCFLPAGETPVPLYRFWNQTKPAFLAGLRLLQIDEILDGQTRFHHFFSSELSQFQVQPIDGAGEIADFCLLGLGRNGHVAFHEPGLPKNFFSGCVSLTKITCEALRVPLGTKGVTYGADAFLRSKSILLLVRGEHKRDILERVLTARDTPASQLLDHRDVTILTDFTFKKA